jgi:hypothetical protein
VTTRGDAHRPDFHRNAPLKVCVRVATTTAGTLASSFENGDSVDGVTLATGDRILLKNQATGSQNGIYVVAASGAPARAYDMDASAEVQGVLVYVLQGTTNGGTLWANTNTGAVTLGSTALTFAQVGGSSGPVTSSGLTMATARLLGRTTAGTGAIEEITVGSGLSLAAGSLSATGGGTGTVTTVEEVDGSPTDSAVTKIVVPNGSLAIVGHVATITFPAGGSSDAVLAQSGSSGIRLPGLSASADAPPASANAADDEFDTTDTSDPMTGWTTLQTPTAHDINSTAKSHYRVQKTAVNAATGHVGIYKAWTPAANDTITWKCTDSVSARVSFQRGFLVWVSEAAPGKMAVFGIADAGSGPQLLVMNYTAPGTFGSTSITLGGSHSLNGPLWLRVKYVSSTSLSWYWSLNGYLFTPALTAHNPGFTIGAFGMGVDTQNATVDGEAIFDWVRKNWTPGT